MVGAPRVAIPTMAVAPRAALAVSCVRRVGSAAQRPARRRRRPRPPRPCRPATPPHRRSPLATRRTRCASARARSCRRHHPHRPRTGRLRPHERGAARPSAPARRGLCPPRARWQRRGGTDSRVRCNRLARSTCTAQRARPTRLARMVWARTGGTKRPA
eukprot:scaffold26497_cov70-Phaeocystis_antarctica.AAC.3